MQAIAAGLQLDSLIMESRLLELKGIVSYAYDVSILFLT